MSDTTRPSTSAAPGPQLFPPTRWSLLTDRASDPAQAAQALRELCEYYRDAIEGWFRLRLPNDAADLASAFIVRWLVRDRLPRVEQREGSRFRYYLATELKNFLNDHYDREQARKRGGGVPPDSIEKLREAGFEPPSDDASQPSSLDCSLSLSLHQKVMKSLECAATDPARFQQISRFVPFEHGNESYSQVAKTLGASLGAIRLAVHRLRDDYFEAFREEVRQLARAGDPAADNELRYLMEILPRALEQQAAG